MKHTTERSENPLVSVIVPVYNVEKYINRAIESIINQTYQNIEILLIDDGSQDGSGIICDEWSLKNNMIKTYHRQNLGPAASRNFGVKYSQGEWIIFIDSDDWVEPQYIEFLLSKALEYDLDVGMCGYYTEYGGHNSTNSFFIYDEKVFNSIDKKMLLKSCVLSTKITSSSTTTNIGVPWAKIYRRAFLINNNLWQNPELKRMQDMVFNLYVFWSAERIFYHQKPLYHYSKENRNAITVAKTANFTDTALKILDELQRFSEISSTDGFDEVVCCKAVKLIIEAIHLQFTNHNKRFITNLNELNSFVYKTKIWNYVKKCNGLYFSTKQKMLMWLIKNRMAGLVLIYMYRAD